MDIKVSMEAMSFYASHGCYDTEQKVGGRFTVEVSYVYDASEAIAGDDVTKAVSYLDVYEMVGTEMAIASHTIEHVAYRICEKMLKSFSLIKKLTISIYKITPPLGGDIQRVGVTLEQER